MGKYIADKMLFFCKPTDAGGIFHHGVKDEDDMY